MQNLNNLNNLNALGIKGVSPFDPSSISVGGVKLLKQQLLTKRTPTLGGILYDERKNKGTARPVQVGRAYLFDDTNDVVAMPSDVVLNGDFTISGWFKRTSVTTRDAFLSRSGTTTYLEFNSSVSAFIKWDDATTDTITIGTMTDNTYFHFALKRSGTTITPYLNGVAGTPITSSKTVTFRDWSTTISIPFGGQMFDMRIYKSALSDSDRTAVQNFKSITPVPEVWYKADEGAGTTSYDSSGNGRHGTITNATLSTFHSTQNTYSYQNEIGYTYMKNAWKQTEMVGTSPWTIQGATVSSTTKTAPDGTSTADEITEDGTTGNHRFFQATAFVTGTIYTISIYLKYVARRYVAVNLAGASTTVIYDLQNGVISGSNGTINASGMESVGNGWYRCWHTATSTTTGNASSIVYGSTTGTGIGTSSYTGLNAVAFEAWGAQIEIGSLTSYLKNVTAEFQAYIPRNEAVPTQDVVGTTLAFTGEVPYDADLEASSCTVVNGTTQYWNIADNAIFDITNNLSVTIRAKNSSTIGAYSEHLITKWTETGNFREWVIGVNLTQKPYVALSSNGSAVAVYTATDAITVSNETTYGFTFSSGTVKLYVNGVLVAGSVTTGSIPASLNNGTSPIAIGSVFASGSVNWKGSLWDARIYKDAVLTDAEMLAIHNGTETTVGATPVAHYPMAENGGNLITNVIAEGTHGLGVNAPTRGTQNSYHYNIVKGFRDYISFDGSNDRVNYESTGVNFDPTLGFTISFFATPYTFTGLDRIVFSLSNSAGVERIISYIKGTTFDMGLYGLTFNSGTPILGSNFTLNTQGHYVMRYNHSTQTVTFWKNGVLVHTQTSVTHTLSSETNCRVQLGARYFSGTTQYYTGLLRGVSFYNSAISDSDIVSLSNNGTVSGAVVNYPLDELTGTTANDVSGNGFNGTIIGSPVRSFIPAKSPTLDALNAPLSNPAGPYHNGCESVIDFTGNVLSPQAVINSWETAWAFNSARTNPEFKRTLTSGGTDFRADRFLAYSQTLSGGNLTKVNKYVTTKAI